MMMMTDYGEGQRREERGQRDWRMMMDVRTAAIKSQIFKIF